MNKVLDIVIQIKSIHKSIPTKKELKKWVKLAIQNKSAEIGLLIVDENESAELNKTYRKKEGPTNVLSFPLGSFQDANLLLGDIVICAPLVIKEAREQNKAVLAHWAHLTIHGTLHLQGFDHIKEADANLMEKKETTLLAKLGFSNPYV